jgi:hypothetical protein
MSAKLRLYFTAGKTPTSAERAEAAALGITCFRNAQHVGSASAIETVSAVAGAVPTFYVKAGAAVIKVGLTAEERAAEAAKVQAEAETTKNSQRRR